MTRQVDHNALRTNQAFIISLLVLAFVLNIPVLVAFVSAVMLVGTFFPKLALFKAVYFRILKPRGLLKPDVVTDNPEPHNFAQGLGGGFTAAAFIALISGAGIVGWALSWLVVALAALNLFVGFCAGCFVYYQLSKRHVPGFTKLPVTK